MNKRDRQLQKLYDKLNESMGIVKTIKKTKPIKKKPIHKKYKAEKEERKKLLYLSYNELLKRPEWQKKRIEILIRDNRKCLVCNSGKNLHIHHRLYEPFLLPWEYNNTYLVTLCRKCHESIHSCNINMKIMEYEITAKIGIVKKSCRE